MALALLAGTEAWAEAGGHSLDPTDPMNYNSYALRNDSTVDRYVRLCADPACARLDNHDDWLLVRPGSAADEQVYWGSSVPEKYAVATSAERANGWRCVALDASTKASVKLDVPLSSATSCVAVK